MHPELEQETTKERLIRIAQADPFLTVEEIAQRAGTTAPYVRTALCLAGVSLHVLRRRVARDLATRLGERSEAAGSEAIATRRDPAEPRGVHPGELAAPRLELCSDESAAAILGIDASLPLMALCYRSATPAVGDLSGVILAAGSFPLKEPVITESAATGAGADRDAANTSTPVWRPLSPAVFGSSLNDPAIRVVPLQVRPLDPTGPPGTEIRLQLECVVVVRGKTIAVERVTYDATRVRCELSSQDGPCPSLVVAV